MHRQRPPLRNGVDLQLQSAFYEGNWPVVARLAEKRARSFNDQYYEVVKICAESQLDDPAAKFGAVAVIEQYVKDGTIVKDVDALDLLDWCTRDFIREDEFPKLIGPLRVRAAKASPKDKSATTRCLESCLLHWDLNSAQQIAAILDRSFPQERAFMFWNIIITHVLSQSPQSPPEKKKLYGTLAQRQIERAAQPTEAGAAKAARSIQTEEEILLLYDIVQTHGTPEDFEKLISNPEFCPLAQFRKGRKHLFQLITEKHRKDGDWEAVFRLCKDCLSENDESGDPSLLASDGSVWRQFIEAASQLKAVNPDAPFSVQSLLLKLKKAKRLPPIYKRNVLLARVLAAFKLVAHDEDDLVDGQPSSLRVRELIHYIDDQSLNPACFNDIKGFVESLDRLGMQYVAYNYLPSLAESEKSTPKHEKLLLLALKTQYLVLSCPLTYIPTAQERLGHTCTVCSAPVSNTPCLSCLRKVSHSALEMYASCKGKDVDEAFQLEIMPDYALLIAFCSIRLAYSHTTPSQTSLSTESLSHLIYALFILERQVLLSPKHSVLLLVLVQLNLRLGSAHRARELWDVLSVKNTILDSLGPIFYDRLSTVSPPVLATADGWGWQLLEMFSAHFSISLKLQQPRQLIDAFKAGSYNSILSMTKYIHNLRTSSTRAMSLVEEARVMRLEGDSKGDVVDDLRFVELADDVFMSELIDYGSFPKWESSESPPIHTLLRLGPPPSNRRAHLSLLAEAFFDVLAYKPPSSYKASANAAHTEQIYVLEQICQICNSLHKYLTGPPSELTRGEQILYDSIGMLSGLMPLSLSTERSALVPDALLETMSAIKTATETLQNMVDRNNGDGVEQVVTQLSSMHDLTNFHDVASATKLIAQWLLAYNERERERDRSGMSSLHKDIIAQMKELLSVAEAALKQGREIIVKLRANVTKSGFEKEVMNWVAKNGKDGSRRDGIDHVPVEGSDAIAVAAELVSSWRLNVGGWQQQVKWT